MDNRQIRSTETKKPSYTVTIHFHIRPTHRHFCFVSDTMIFQVFQFDVESSNLHGLLAGIQKRVQEATVQKTTGSRTKDGRTSLHVGLGLGWRSCISPQRQQNQFNINMATFSIYHIDVLSYFLTKQHTTARSIASATASHLAR